MGTENNNKINKSRATYDLARLEMAKSSKREAGNHHSQSRTSSTDTQISRRSIQKQKTKGEMEDMKIDKNYHLKS